MKYYLLASSGYDVCLPKKENHTLQLITLRCLGLLHARVKSFFSHRTFSRERRNCISINCLFCFFSCYEYHNDD